MTLHTRALGANDLARGPSAAVWSMTWFFICKMGVMTVTVPISQGGCESNELVSKALRRGLAHNTTL